MNWLAILGMWFLFLLVIDNMWINYLSAKYGETEDVEASDE